MIDCESEIYSPIAKALRQQFPGIHVVSTRLSSEPSDFPCVALYEMDNYSPRDMIDSSGTEKFSDIAWQIQIYSNKLSVKKSECREIFRFVDSLMFAQGFTRESNTPEIPINNNSIYWLSARYTARTDGTYIYRN